MSAAIHLHSEFKSASGGNPAESAELDINVNALRPYLGYGNIILRDDSDNSNYNSLQVSVSRRLRSGLSFGANYTFSKTMDSFGGGTPQDSYNPKQDIGLSVHSPRAYAEFQLHLHASVFREERQHGWLATVLGGWEVPA